MEIFFSGYNWPLHITLENRNKRLRIKVIVKVLIQKGDGLIVYIAAIIYAGIDASSKGNLSKRHEMVYGYNII